jgi:hypothetical protein
MGDWIILLALVVALGAAGISAWGLHSAAKEPLWRKEITRKMTVLEDEWEDMLDKIKRRGDRLSKERGLLSKKETPQEDLSDITGKNRLWALKRSKERVT